jgi:hypothetical protein
MGGWAATRAKRARDGSMLLTIMLRKMYEEEEARSAGGVEAHGYNRQYAEWDV